LISFVGPHQQTGEQRSAGYQCCNPLLSGYRF